MFIFQTAQLYDNHIAASPKNKKNDQSGGDILLQFPPRNMIHFLVGGFPQIISLYHEVTFTFL